MNKQILLHSYGVADYMYRHASQNKEELFVLGLLHDIGKLKEYSNHAKVGFDIAEKVGLVYAKEIQYHGLVQEEYSSYELDLLNAADLSVDSCGNEVGYEKRLEDILSRYGKESFEYKTAKELVSILQEKGFLPIG